MTDASLATMSAVTHRYGDVVALDGLDLEIRAGEVLAVLGPNGAGKTTAIGLLLGTLLTQDGTVRVFGHEPGASAVRMRRGAMLQISGVPDTLTIAEHVELFSSYYPAPLPVSRLLAMAGLEDLADRRYGRLSGGQKQRVMFALALAGDPELVFLDEPNDGARRRGAPQPVERNPRAEGGRPHRGAHHALPGGGGRRSRTASQ